MLYPIVTGLFSIVLYISLIALQELMLARKLRRLHCDSPPRYPQRIPFLGLDFASLLDRSRKEGALLSKLQLLFRRYGKTFQATVWGQTIVHTMDAANIQCVHTQRFKSFGVEPIRKTVNQRWMGDGIFVSDDPFGSIPALFSSPTFPRTSLLIFRALILMSRDCLPLSLKMKLQLTYSRFSSV